MAVAKVCDLGLAEISVLLSFLCKLEDNFETAFKWACNQTVSEA